MTRESVNRQFRVWKEAGLLASQDDGYVVTDPVRLQESAIDGQSLARGGAQAP